MERSQEVRLPSHTMKGINSDLDLLFPPFDHTKLRVSTQLKSPTLNSHKTLTGNSPLLDRIVKKESITSGKIFNIAHQLTPKLVQAANAQYSDRVFDLTLREQQHVSQR